MDTVTMNDSLAELAYYTLTIWTGLRKSRVLRAQVLCGAFGLALG